MAIGIYKLVFRISSKNLIQQFLLFSNVVAHVLVVATLIYKMRSALSGRCVAYFRLRFKVRHFSNFLNQGIICEFVLFLTESGFASSGGHFVSQYEIAGRFTSLIIGNLNFSCSFAGVIAPYFVGKCRKFLICFIYIILNWNPKLNKYFKRFNDF